MTNIGRRSFSKHCASSCPFDLVSSFFARISGRPRCSACNKWQRLPSKDYARAHILPADSGAASIRTNSSLREPTARQDYTLKAKELAIRAREAKKKEKGTPGGIRIVLPSVPADPLQKPGQKPRPLRLLSLSPLLVH